jgi:hypothetical protein
VITTQNQEREISIILFDIIAQCDKVFESNHNALAVQLSVKMEKTHECKMSSSNSKYGITAQTYDVN